MDRGATVDAYDSHVIVRVSLQRSSFVGLEDTDITTNDLAIESTDSWFAIAAGEIDSVVALDSQYQNTLLETVLYHQSSASLHQGTQVSSLACSEGSDAYCTTGTTVGASNCGSCPAP